MRPQTHMATIAANCPPGDATAPVRALLELGLKNKLAAEVDTREPGAHVSMAGKCPRQIFFNLTGVPKTEPLTLDSWFTLNLGNKTEELFTDLLEAAGVTILHQQTMKLEVDGETITGTLDMLLEIPESVREIVPGLDPVEVWETKSKNSRAMGWLLKQGGPNHDDGYVKQLGGYLHGAVEGKVPKPTHARGRLTYVATGSTKGEPLLHSWWVDYDQEAVTADLKILAAAAKSARSGEDPGIPHGYDLSKFPCSYCSWKRKCFPMNGKGR